VSNVESVFPFLQIATAASPFAAAAVLRLALGRNRFTEFLLSASTMWFAINLLLAPFTDPTRLGRWLLH